MKQRPIDDPQPSGRGRHFAAKTDQQCCNDESLGKTADPTHRVCSCRTCSACMRPIVILALSKLQYFLPLDSSTRSNSSGMHHSLAMAMLLAPFSETALQHWTDLNTPPMCLEVFRRQHCKISTWEGIQRGHLYTWAFDLPLMNSTISPPNEEEPMTFVSWVVVPCSRGDGNQRQAASRAWVCSTTEYWHQGTAEQPNS